MRLDDYKIILEENGVDPKKVDEIIDALEPMSDAMENLSEKDIRQQIFKLQGEMSEEKDWRKKAKKAAQIVSLGLE